jgi:hypothetical protein
MEKEMGKRSENRMWEGREGWEKVRKDRKGTMKKEKRICTLRTRKEFIYMKVEK